MIIINETMKNNTIAKELSSINLCAKLTNYRIKTFLQRNLTFQNGALFLDFNNCQTPPNQQILKTYYGDLTGYESILNSVYLSDFLYDDLKVDFSLVSQYCSEIARYKERNRIQIPLVFIAKIIEEDTFDIWITFHLLRENEFYLNKDLDTYGEAIAVFTG